MAPVPHLFAACIAGLMVQGVGASACAAAPVVLTAQGQTPKLCTLGEPQVNQGGATNLGAVTGASVDIAQLAEPTTLRTKATAFDINFDAVCNYVHKVTISSDNGGLFRATLGSPRPGFANGVPYQATVDWADEETVMLAPAASVGQTSQTLTVGNPAAGTLTVKFRIDAGASNGAANTPLMAGPYRDTLRVTLGPQ